MMNTTQEFKKKKKVILTLCPIIGSKLLIKHYSAYIFCFQSLPPITSPIILWEINSNPMEVLSINQKKNFLFSLFLFASKLLYKLDIQLSKLVYSL